MHYSDRGHEKSSSRKDSNTSTLNIKAAFTLVWLLTTCIIFLYGVQVLYNRSVWNTLSCDISVCSITYRNSTTKIRRVFPRTDLIDSEVVQIENKQIYPHSENHPIYWYSLQVRYRYTEKKQKVLRADVLSDFNINELTAKRYKEKVSNYKARKTFSLVITAAKYWDYQGACCAILGAFFLLSGLAWGDLSYPFGTSKRMQKKSI